MTEANAGDMFQAGDLLNNTYRIEKILGRGGTSEVYKARSEVSGKVMAIKALRAEFASNDDFLVLMTREEDVREIRHDAVVRYFDTQRMPDGVVYLVMDFVDGPALDTKMNGGGMAADDLLTIGQRVCEGLVAAHQRNIVHRDLSPDNIILRNDQPNEAVIIDFGIAKDTNPGAETIVGNEFAGKYAYAAPEQLAGQTDARSDLYALGVLLLATFRGEAPKVGKNPMEVVNNKTLPPETQGVPEPLKGLIERMTHPDPASRFQSAQELLDAFGNPDQLPPAQDDLTGSTVITPKPSTPDAPDPLDELLQGVPKAKPEPKAPEPTAKRKSALVPVLVVCAVIGGGAGAYFGGLFDSLLDPGYPVADPYTLLVEKTSEGTARVAGHVPSPEVEGALSQLVARLDPVQELALASGDIGDDWGLGLVEIVDGVLELDEFRVSVTGDQVDVSGLAPSQEVRSQVQAVFALGFPAGFSGTLDIALGPRFLQPETINAVLRTHADCGPLYLSPAPPLGYGFDDTVIVTGRFAEESTRDTLQRDLAMLAGDRSLRIEAETLNPSLCEIDALLPTANPGGFDVRFGFGDRDAQNLSGRYQVGENPTIDIRLPDDVEDGYLWVSVIDVQGVVFHLLPNRTRPDNSIAALRAEATDGFVRVAYGLEEAEGRLAFTVDGSVLGKSKILVLESDQPLFSDLRPTTESVASYADALTEARDTGGLYVNSLDSALLTTEE